MSEINYFKKCKSLALARNLPEGDRPAIRVYRQNVTALAGRKRNLNYELCAKVLDKYEPNGLIMDVPASWDCEKDGMKN